MHRHVIVDGSNLATEGRSKPSLAQLNDAVTSFMAEHPETTVTVIVDATFGHRIDKKERAEFDEAISNNELVAPPAGAIGRGDAFVLGVADKVKAAVLSNDSYQEFHGKYTWLFTEGRLIGGKPVPNVGWVFVERLPVRGPVSRRATAGGHGGDKAVAKLASKAGTKPQTRSVRLSAEGPPPVPKAPPPGAVVAAGRPANDALTFVAFREAHPAGSTVRGTVESYSSHGATVKVGDAVCYVPLRLLADPPPRSARDHLKIGDTVSLMVAGYRPDRRSIDVGLPAVVKSALRDGRAATEPPVEATRTKPTERPVARTARTAKKATVSRARAGNAVSKPAKKTATRSAARSSKSSAKPIKKAAAPAKKKVAAKKSVARKSPAATKARSSATPAKTRPRR